MKSKTTKSKVKTAKKPKEHRLIPEPPPKAELIPKFDYLNELSDTHLVEFIEKETLIKTTLPHHMRIEFEVVVIAARAELDVRGGMRKSKHGPHGPPNRSARQPFARGLTRSTIAPPAILYGDFTWGG